MSGQSTPKERSENRVATLNRGLTGEEEKRVFYGNPLLVDGFPLDYTWFSIQSRGKLSVVAGDPSEPDAVKIPIRVYLRREGVNVGPDGSGMCRGAVDVNLAEVMSGARAGDELVIEPLRKEDAVARRVIRLKLFWFLPNPMGRKGDGC
ncbi:hypothetical protein GCM10027299_07270 [Larkinella ripae]